MAMMMTGRVLLVCALCVLWCGAGGRCDEALPVVVSAVNPASGGVVTDNAAGQTAPGEAEGLSAHQPQLESVGGSPSGGSRSQADLQPQSPTIQLTHSGAENTVPSTTSKPLGEKMQNVPDEGPPGEPGILSSQEEAIKKTIVNQQSNDPPSHSINNDVVSRNRGERTEGNSRRAETLFAAHSEEGQEREKVTPSLEQPHETSTAAPAITTQTISMTPPDESEINTVKISEASPQSTGTAQTKHTATPGDSDSSTAVSHNFSPLLLLVVACVAAAAVVAA
ncbi:Mucin-associated surface protein (MASP), subgroup S004 [Trypanosoma cruzi]|nr:Mucin-associated surface protein (MASP), subgroup S004 [Trypanosoma cruzi]